MQRQIREALQRKLNTSDIRLTPLATGRHNSAYWVETPDSRYVLRIAPPDETGLLFYERRMMRQEPRLHELVLSRTSIPAARIVAHDFTRELLPRDYLLMNVLPGRPLSEASLSWRQVENVLRQTGACLRQLHSLIATDCLGTHAFGYLGEHRPMEPQPSWQEAFAVMWSKLLADVHACGAYDTSEVSDAEKLFERHRSVFTHEVQPRLLHMDVWSENILVDDAGNVTGLVDFDRALWGDPEIEFAVLDYCGISEPPFWEGYGSPRDQSDAAQLRRLFYLAYELQKYMPIYAWRRPNSGQAVRRYKRQAEELLHALAST